MTALALNQSAKPTRNPFTLSPMMRALIWLVAVGMSLISAYAIFRGVAGLGATHGNMRNLAVLIHVAAVLPAIPLGGYVLLARKGTPLHKRLGRIWLGLMIVTALSAIFIRGDFSVGPIHFFIPWTLIISWRVVATARAGNIEAHKGHLLGMYLGALAIPGLWSFAPGRMLGAMLWG